MYDLLSSMIYCLQYRHGRGLARNLVARFPARVALNVTFLAVFLRCLKEKDSLPTEAP